MHYVSQRCTKIIVSWNHTSIIPCTICLLSNALRESAVDEINYVSQNHTVDSRNALDERHFVDGIIHVQFHDAKAQMLAYDIYYMDLITFVYKMSLFCPHNEQVHSAFSHKMLSVHESTSTLQYFVDTMLICWCFSWTKGVTVFHGFVMNLLRFQIVA